MVSRSLRLFRHLLLLINIIFVYISNVNCSTCISIYTQSYQLIIHPYYECHHHCTSWVINRYLLFNFIIIEESFPMKMFHKTIEEEQLCFIKTVALVKFQKQDQFLFEKTTSQNTTLYPHIHKHQLHLPTIGPVRKSTVSHTALFWTSQAYSVNDSSMRDCD